MGRDTRDATAIIAMMGRVRLKPDATYARGAVGIILCALLYGAGCGGKNPIQPPPPPPPPPDQLQLSCPADQLLEATSPAGADAHFEPPRAVGGLAPVGVECAPGSGSGFPIGETSVQCTATAADMAQVLCGFKVRVRVSQTLLWTKYVAFGDSITEGAISMAPLLMLGEPETYPYKLSQLLMRAYPSQIIVVSNYGKGGERTLQGATRLPSVLGAEQPHVLLLLEGINQINERTTLEQAKALETMIDTARRANVQTIIATVMPVTPRWKLYKPTTPEKIEALNERIFELAAEYRIGPPVDLFTIFSADISLIGGDGLHPTPEGQTRIAEAFHDEIVRRYGQRSTLTQRLPIRTKALSPLSVSSLPAATVTR